MKVKVNKNACIGCGACTGICPDVFLFDDDGLAKVIVDEVKEEEKEAVIEASENCPTSAIETNE